MVPIGQTLAVMGVPFLAACCLSGGRLPLDPDDEGGGTAAFLVAVCLMWLKVNYLLLYIEFKQVMLILYYWFCKSTKKYNFFVLIWIYPKRCYIV